VFAESRSVSGGKLEKYGVCKMGLSLVGVFFQRVSLGEDSHLKKKKEGRFQGAESQKGLIALLGEGIFLKSPSRKSGSR